MMPFLIFCQNLEQVDDELAMKEMEVIQQELAFFVKQPLNLNFASREELRKFPLFSDQQIYEILHHRLVHQQFVEVEELVSLNSFSTEFVKKNKQFFCLSDVEIPIQSSHQLIFRNRFSDQKSSLIKDTLHGFDQSQLSIRYQGVLNQYWKVGFVLEKDQNEDFFEKSNQATLSRFYKGFDYSNAYLQYQGKGLFQQVILGAYRLQLGQGLLYWNGWSLGKSNYIHSLEKKGYPLLPYTSANETNALQGVSVKIGKNHWELISFYSNQNKDARIQNDQIQTIYKTGLHQKPSEIARKKTLNEQILGSNFQFRYHNLKVGSTFSWHHYQYSFAPSTELYKQENLKGKDLQNISLYYQYENQKILLFAEYVKQSHQKKAFIQGVTLKINPIVSYTALYRNYQNGFFSLYANAFSEASNPQNEIGFYQGMDFYFSPKWHLQAYIDFYEFPYFRYQHNFPTKGNDYVLQLSHQISQRAHFYLRYKFEKREEKMISKKQQIRSALKFEHYPFTFQSNLALHFSQIDLKEQGYLLYQTIQYKIPFFKRKLKLTYRGAYYTTSSFKTAIYAYEHDVLYSFSFPAYYGQGFRQYMVLRYKLNQSIKMDLKIGHQHFSHQNDYRKKWDFNVQLFYEF